MSCLCQEIKEIQRDVAAMPTDELKATIEWAVGRMEEAMKNLSTLCGLPMVSGNADSLSDSTADACDRVHAFGVLTALYVRELVRRPVQPTVYVQTDFSVN
jgi:hypothetical protein